MSTPAQLDALIDELTVDACNDEEQEWGFLVGAEAALAPGEMARLLGIDVEVLKIESGPDCGPDHEPEYVVGATRKLCPWQI